jgi:hypothetical protein
LTQRRSCTLTEPMSSSAVTIPGEKQCSSAAGGIGVVTAPVTDALGPVMDKK